MSARHQYYSLLGGAGAASGVVYFPDQLINAQKPGMCIGAIKFLDTGVLQIKDYMAYNNVSGQWLTTTPDTATAALYEVYAEVLYSDTPVYGTLASWVPMTASPSFRIQSNVPGDLRSCTLKITIRLASSHVIAATANVDITAESM